MKYILKINKFKICLLIFIGFYFSVGVSVYTKGWSHTFKSMCVNTLSPVFADLRPLQAMIINSSNFNNIHKTPVKDPWGREQNYPKIWLYIAKFISINDNHNLIIFAAIMITLYIITCIHFIKCYPYINVVLLMLSSSQLLIIERGNIDMVIFTLLTLGLTIANNYIACFIIYLTSILKIYPYFAVVYLYNKSKILALTVLPLAFYFLLNYSELISNRYASGSESRNSYGSTSIELFLKEFTKLRLSSLFITVILLSISISIYYILYSGKKIQLKIKENNNFKIFLAGASIYLMTFILHSNYDYRLIFLLFTLPFILELNSKIIKYVYVICSYIAFNYLYIASLLNDPDGRIYHVQLLVHIAQCGIFIVLVILLTQFLFQSFPKRYLVDINQ